MTPGERSERGGPISEGTLLWEPSPEQVREASLTQFMAWLGKEKNQDVGSYAELWEWSVTELEEFWGSVWAYFAIPAARGYEEVLGERTMPGARWFPGARLNFVEQILRHRDREGPALIFQDEASGPRTLSWAELHRQTASAASALRELGVGPGDRVAAYITNGPEAVVAMLATASLGAIWTSASPDFGAGSLVERFGQVAPKVLIAVDGYRYGGKTFPRMERVAQLQREIPELEYTLLIPTLSDEPDLSLLHDAAGTIPWPHILRQPEVDLKPEPLPFDHPLWILYSSGTTGLPKPIVHGHGGMLLEHLKYMAFHADVRPGDRFFWFTTTGWMMWNVVVAALLRGATAVLYEGSPGHPSLDTLWDLTEEQRITHFGASAAYLTACMKEGLAPGRDRDLSELRIVGSTGSPLPPEAFRWVYDTVSPRILLNSTSGGTDICSSFVGGNPILPVHAGEIQCRTLGAKVEAYDEEGRPVVDQVGEMVLTEPMPSMPLHFWGDDDGSRYRESYFETYPGVWRHGDWIKVTSRGSCVIYGRSDATLNRMGVRIGTSEIYRAVEEASRVQDSLVVSLERKEGSWYMPLFVQLAPGDAVDEELEKEIRTRIRERISPRFVPDDIVQVEEIPYTLSGKKMEKPVKEILQGTPAEEAASPDSMRNPGALEDFGARAARLDTSDDGGTTDE